MMVQMRPVVVDPWRRGGMLAGRNFFGGAPLSSLGGSYSPRLAQVSSAAASAISTLIDNALDSLEREVDAAGVEADMVSPASLRVQPDDYTQIGLVGTVLAPQEIRSVILADARALDGLASRIQTGALSHYLSPSQTQRLSSIRSKIDRLVQYLQGLDIQNVLQQNLAVANQHVDSHLRAVNGPLGEAEKAVVTAEAGNVPVLEPSEKTLSKGMIVAGVGVAAGVGLLLWTLLS